MTHSGAAQRARGHGGRRQRSWPSVSHFGGAPRALVRGRTCRSAEFALTADPHLRIRVPGSYRPGKACRSCSAFHGRLGDGKGDGPRHRPRRHRRPPRLHHRVPGRRRPLLEQRALGPLQHQAGMDNIALVRPLIAHLRPRYTIDRGASSHRPLQRRDPPGCSAPSSPARSPRSPRRRVLPVPVSARSRAPRAPATGPAHPRHGGRSSPTTAGHCAAASAAC